MQSCLAGLPQLVSKLCTGDRKARPDSPTITSRKRLLSMRGCHASHRFHLISIKSKCYYTLYHSALSKHCFTPSPWDYLLTSQSRYTMFDGPSMVVRCGFCLSKAILRKVSSDRWVVHPLLSHLISVT